MPEKTKPTRRDFIDSIGKVLGAVGLVVATAWPLSIVAPEIIQECTKPSYYESLSKAKEDLYDARGFIVMPRFRIIGRVKSMTPEKPSPDELVKLVLTDGTTDMGFYIHRDNTKTGVEDGLFNHLKSAADEGYYNTVVMYYLRTTRIGDEVEVATNPHLAVGEYYIAKEFRKRII